MQIIDTSTLLGETLGEQFAPAFTTHDQYPRCRTGNRLVQRGQLQECFAVIAGRRETDLAALVLKNLRRRSPHGKPG
ncbi:hypothetical protein D3C72_2029200 [compost metagenome]